MNVNYKLGSVDGDDLLPKQEYRGRIEYTYTDINDELLTREAEAFSVFTEVPGYTLVETIGDTEGVYIYEEHEVTLVYIKDELKPDEKLPKDKDDIDSDEPEKPIIDNTEVDDKTEKKVIVSNDTLESVNADNSY